MVNSEFCFFLFTSMRGNEHWVSRKTKLTFSLGAVNIISQGAKKVVSDSPGLVDFAIGLVNSVLNLPDGQAKIFRRIQITKVL